MSVTAVLVPFAENEAEALLAANREEALRPLLARARTLRPRLARLDGVREELHAALFHKWNHEAGRAPSPLVQVWRLVTKARGEVREFAGYDPFVHLFGRSLPATGATSRDVAAAIARLCEADDAAFETALAADLRGLDPKAAGLFLEARTPAVEGLDEAFGAEARRLEAGLSGEDYKAAFDALVRLQAWSRPVWRLDGAMLEGLLGDVGVQVEAGSGADFFQEALDPPPSEAALARLPRGLETFSGPGAYFPAARVKVLAGALRLQRARIRANATQSDERTAIVLRHVRLVEEAALYCEAHDLGLCEAAGVEWHDRTHA